MKVGVCVSSGFTDSQVFISCQVTFASLLILVDWVSYQDNRKHFLKQEVTHNLPEGIHCLFFQSLTMRKNLPQSSCFLKNFFELWKLFQ